MRGIRRTVGGARNKKAPAVAAKMLGMVATACWVSLARSADPS